MELNITPDSPHLSRPQPSPRSTEHRSPAVLNDLNAPGERIESFDDNTQVPGYDNNLSTSQNSSVNRRRRPKRGPRRYTLSIIEKELEEAKRLIEAKIDPKTHGDNNVILRKPDTDKSKLLNQNLSSIGSETETKTPYEATREVRSRVGSRSEKVYARYVQEGERNLMLIYEPKESRSEVYCKQIGNKNVMVHLNVSSNLCQLIDRENKGIIPLDSEGEVWLEIKRRSQVIQTDAASLSDNVFDDSCMYSKVKHGNVYTADSFLSGDSYVEGKVADRLATENAETEDERPYDGYELDDGEEERPYNTISIKERGDSLMIKFEKWNQHGVLNSDSPQKSPILSHQKVIDFLRDKGNNFDVNICDWGYEKEESVYSYISSNLQLVDINEDYTEIPATEQQFRPRDNEPEEHSASSFGQSFDHGYDTPLEPAPVETELYSKVDKTTLQYTHGKHQVAPVDTYRREDICPTAVKTDEKGISRSQSEPAVETHAGKEISSRSPTNRRSYPGHAKKKPEVPSRPPNRHHKQDLTECKWYHGKIEKSVAKERLKGKEHGSFLVRDASGGTDSAHRYTIEFIDGHTVKKLMIMNTNSKYHFKEYEDKKFDRVEQLIHTIMTNGLEVKDNDTDKWKNIKVKPVSHA